MESTDLKSEIVRRYQRGESYKLIARDCRRTAATVRRWLVDAGVDIRSGGAPAKTLQIEAVCRYDAGETIQSLKQAFKVSYDTLGDWLSRSGRKSRRQADLARRSRSKADAIRSYHEGASSTQVGAALGCHPGTVLKYLNEEGLVRTRSEAVFMRLGKEPIPPPSAAALSLLYEEQELSGAEISRMWGVAPGTVLSWLDKAGIQRRSRSEANALKWRRGQQRPPVPSADKLVEWVKAHPDLNREFWKKGLDRSHRLRALRGGPRPVPCGWCGGVCMRKRRQRTVYAASFCNLSHSAKGANHRRYHPDEPRPLILELLRQGADPQEIGAGEIELRELELEKQLERLNACP